MAKNNSRLDTIKKLVSFSDNIENIKDEIQKYSWDYEGKPYVLTKIDMINICKKYINHELSQNDIVIWANLIEGREDIDFEITMLEDIIYLFANPNLEGAATVSKCEEFIKKINSKEQINNKISKNTTLKEQIDHKIDTVLRQYELEWDESIQRRKHPYIKELQKIKDLLFSKDLNQQKKGLKGLESLLLSLRAWDDYFHFSFDSGDKYKDKFIDNFNNWNEWYEFLESIVSDAKEYLKQENIDI